MVGDMFELATFGYEGRVKCFVNFSADNNTEVEIRDSISDFSVTEDHFIVGNALKVNIAINLQG